MKAYHTGGGDGKTPVTTVCPDNIAEKWKQADGTLCIPGHVYLLSRYSLVLTCVVCLEIEEDQRYSFRARVHAETETKLVHLWKTRFST